MDGYTIPHGQPIRLSGPATVTQCVAILNGSLVSLRIRPKIERHLAGHVKLQRECVLVSCVMELNGGDDLRFNVLQCR